MDLQIAIDGMHCQACVRRVQAALEKVPGVAVTDVEIGRAQLQVEGDGGAAAVIAALERAGYPARPGS